MLQHLFKPKWQSKKATVRLKALANLSGESDTLILLAKTDTDSEVRLYAVQKLQHIPTLAIIAAKTDGVIPRAAKKRLSELALKPNIDENALEQAYVLITDPQVHRHVICDTQKTLTVRKHALQYIEDQHLLFELANTDLSKEIQFLAATKITDYAQLKQLEKRTKNNKRLRKLLKEKSQAYQIQQQQQHALQTLCLKLEQLGNKHTWNRDKTQFLIIQQQWKKLAHCASPDLQQRYEQGVHDFTTKQVLHADEEAKLQPLRDHYNKIISSLERVLATLADASTTLSVAELKAVLTQQQQQWETPSYDTVLPAQELADLQHRYHQVRQNLNNNIQPLQQQQDALQNFATILSDAKALQNQQTIQAKQIESLQQRWKKIKVPPLRSATLPMIAAPQQQYKALIHALKQQLQQQQQHIEQYTQQIEQWLDQMEDYIEAEQLSKAIQLYQQATQLLNQHTFPSVAYQRIKRRINAATPTIKSAQSWRYWGTDQAREQLIQAAQVLSEANDIAPLERAKQLKALRHKWKKLGKIDPRHQQKQWQDFDALCTKAYAPCQQFYQEESHSRNENLSQRQKICTELQQLEQTTHWHTVDWKKITKTINQYRKQWKQAGAVDRNHWKIINQQFNNAMDALEQHLDEERRINWAKRQKLVTQAETLWEELKQDAESTDKLSRCIEDAKQLQTHWRPTITRHRNEEQALWNQFRAAIDAIFNQQRDRQQENQSQRQQNLARKQQLLQQMTALLDSNDSDHVDTLQSQFKQLQTQFNNIEALPKGKAAYLVQSEFNRLNTQFTDYVLIQQKQQQLQQILLLAEKSKLCRVVTKDDAVQTAWKASQPLYDKQLQQKITHCFQATDIQHSTPNVDDLFELILDIEILLELPTASAYQEARMKRQVERLSQQMLSVSESTMDKQQQALVKITEYYLQCANHAENYAITEARFSQIEAWIKTLLENTKKC